MGEAKELVEKKLLTSSCCPAFVSYILKFYPELKDKISHSLSPMAQTGKMIKEKYPDALTVFIGPCTAKKDERSKPEVRPYVDYVLTFVELRAMFAARDIEVEKLPGIPLDNASPFARGFARSGGLSDAVVQAIKELNIKDFQLSPMACSGMRECIKALENLSLGTNKVNFIEGMACEGGCICGPESLNHNPAVGKAYVQSHARTSTAKTITDSVTKSQNAKYEDAETLASRVKNSPSSSLGKHSTRVSFSSIPFRRSTASSVKAPEVKSTETKSKQPEKPAEPKTVEKPKATAKPESKIPEVPKVETKPAEAKPVEPKVETKQPAKPETKVPQVPKVETKPQASIPETKFDAKTPAAAKPAQPHTIKPVSSGDQVPAEPKKEEVNNK